MTDNPALIHWRMPQPFLIEKRSSPQRGRYMEMLREALPDSEVDIEDFDPVFFRVIASDQSLDSYYTRMTEGTIENYVEDAKKGVSLQQSHNGHQSLGLGRSLDGEVTGTKTNRKAELLFYTVPGLVSGGVSSENLITGIRSGVYRDVSVGFTPDYFECSICGKDPFDYRAKWEEEDACWHWPGLDYKNEKGKTETASAWIHNARLNEVSFVYDGANENAGIIAIEKARFAKQRGLLPEQIETMLERRYKIEIPGPPKSWRGVENVGKRADGAAENSEQPVVNDELEFLVEEAEVPNTEVTEENPAAEEVAVEFNEEEQKPVSAPVANAEAERWTSTRAKHEGPGKLFKSMGDDPVRAADALATEVTRLRAKLSENQRHVAFGDAYEKSLIRECHAEGIRAMGEAYKRDHWDGVYHRMDAAELEATRDQYRVRGDKLFGEGRVTTEVVDNTPIRIDDESSAEYSI